MADKQTNPILDALAAVKKEAVGAIQETRMEMATMGQEMRSEVAAMREKIEDMCL
jgi:hypothetical protein